ncbi:MAG TPA: hypothetical protein VF531_00030 [Bacillota bacterium]
MKPKGLFILLLVAFCIAASMIIYSAVQNSPEIPDKARLVQMDISPWNVLRVTSGYRFNVRCFT